MKHRAWGEQANGDLSVEGGQTPTWSLRDHPSKQNASHHLTHRLLSLTWESGIIKMHCYYMVKFNCECYDRDTKQKLGSQECPRRGDRDFRWGVGES